MYRRQVLVAFFLGIASATLVLLVPYLLKPGVSVPSPLKPGVSANPPKMALMIRTASKPKLLYQFYCLFLRTTTFFWPAYFGEIVVILDHESGEDHKFGDSLLKQFKVHYPEYNLRIQYEREPSNDKIWKSTAFRGAGYNRQLYSTFISDQYTTNDIIAYMDADNQFLVPMTQRYLMPGGKPKVFGFRVVNEGWMKIWVKTTEMGIGLKMVANFMVVFPQMLHRDTITNCRKHMLKHLNVSNIESAIEIFYGPGKIITPINMFMNYAWYYERDRYDWHLAMGDMEQVNRDLPPKHHILPSDTVPSIVGIAHLVISKKWDESMMVPGYCASMAASGVYISGCRNITHDFNLLCHFNNKHHRFPWPGVGKWCSEGRLSPCCKKAAVEHYQEVTSMVESGYFKFNKTKPMLVQSLAQEMGVTCEPLILP